MWLLAKQIRAILKPTSVSTQLNCNIFARRVLYLHWQHVCTTILALNAGFYVWVAVKLVVARDLGLLTKNWKIYVSINRFCSLR